MELILTIVMSIFGLVAYVPYTISILKRETKPSRTSWIIWAILDMLTVLAYFKSGVQNTIFLPIVFTIGAFLIAILSIKYGRWGSIKEMIVVFMGSMIGIVIWIASKAEYGLYVFIVVLIISAIPTIKKSWSKPKEEDGLSWACWLIAGILSLFVLEEWIFSKFILLLSYVILDIIILYPILRFKLKLKNPKLRNSIF